MEDLPAPPVPVMPKDGHLGNVAVARDRFEGFAETRPDRCFQRL